jgi:hypothetical protein
MSILSARGREEALVVARQFDHLAVRAQIIDRREMQRVERAHKHRKRFDGAGEDVRCQVDVRNAGQQCTRVVSEGRGRFQRVDPVPDLVLKQAT